MVLTKEVVEALQYMEKYCSQKKSEMLLRSRGEINVVYEYMDEGVNIVVSQRYSGMELLSKMRYIAFKTLERVEEPETIIRILVNEAFNLAEG